MAATSIFSFLLRLLRWLGLFVLLFFAYVTANLVYGTLTDYQPEEKITLDIRANSAPTIVNDSLLSFLSWNLGYGGLGAQSNFFYGGGGFLRSHGKMVRSPRPLVEQYVAGMAQTIRENPVDFYLLQEVDVASKRSYYIDQQATVAQIRPQYAATFAVNYQVQRVPTPLLEPWNSYGRTYGGLGTFSRYAPQSAQRLQLPGVAQWPNRLFLLDRCLAVHRYPTAWGKELVVVNLHNSAFDRDGSIKAVQMEYLKNLLLAEYNAGHYLVVGGDWNQCPPGFAFDTFHPEGSFQSYAPNIAADFMPADWQWVYDPKVPTNRSNRTVYRPGETFTTLIDYFLVSPNVAVLEVQCIDEQFADSDHQAVRMQVRLR
ncbi:MAG: endonuclease/exonuclease/phosphatase family protein [Bacteroidota bacterium]